MMEKKNCDYVHESNIKNKNDNNNNNNNNTNPEFTERDYEKPR